MSGYASERGGDYYTCKCGQTTNHSHLTSSRDGYVASCCIREEDLLAVYYGGICFSYLPRTVVEAGLDPKDYPNITEISKRVN